ncbi:MAG: ABC transporter permease subunit [Methylococcaceae bacterium]|nr:ABC transporter permease subunit [Methylococcaceae bacterium]
MSEINISQPQISPIQKASQSRYQQWRLIKDWLAAYGVAIGGLGVIFAIVLIFFYLLYVVFPLFISAEATAFKEYPVPAQAQGKTLLLATEEQNEVAVRFTDQGKAIFFAVATGKVLLTESLTLPEETQITSFAQGTPAKGVVAYGLSNGSMIIAKHEYKITYPNDKRLITPFISYPLGKEPLILDKKEKPLVNIALRLDEEVSTLVAKTADNRIVLISFEKQESLFGDNELERTDAVLDLPASNIKHLLIDKEQRSLYLASEKGRLSFFNIVNKNKPELWQHLNVVNEGEKITALAFLNGDLSLLVGDSSGLLAQWSMVRDAQNRPALQKLRSFKVSDSAVVGINAEQRRKGFMAIDAKGKVGIYHSTAERQLIEEQVSESLPLAVTLSPRANHFLVETTDNKLHVWKVDNEHPDISLKSIWQEVWYESYPKPDYIWQSSSSSNDFEPKMSLTPLVFGTLKAAFYTMLVATPLALMGAIYTAYFMSPAMRLYVKPGIEMMGALPTVILGFLAGLWLAPFFEAHLTGIFALLMIVPLSVMIFAYAWQHLPEHIRHKIPEGWYAAILIPVILLASWLSFVLNAPIEDLFFNGNLQIWLSDSFGISYDQRNSLIVGVAMGVAVIPTIFSIAEDAIFSVPKHLTVGSLALGATPWQTMSRVVLLTASPGIFSAIMIGFGRAVGETMIVLMATGNTPIMDMSVFQGMRTLAANIAVEMPESEVDSTHYRVLFLAALVLFMFTFVFNTLAELIRQNLREKYSSL